MATETSGPMINLDAELAELLCIALDGTDTVRVRLLVELIALRQDLAHDRPVRENV